MNDALSLDEALVRVCERDTRYPERAFLFVLAALEYAQGKLDQRRHLSGGELALACRDFALEQFGLMSSLSRTLWNSFFQYGIPFPCLTCTPRSIL